MLSSRKRHALPHSFSRTPSPANLLHHHRHHRHLAGYLAPVPAIPPRCSSRRIMRGRTMARRSRAANCTHVTMDRVYGHNQLCSVCGNEPSMGYLYECREDCVPWTPQYKNLGGAPKSALRCRLERVGLSESVIAAAEQGHYEDLQLEILIAQKAELNQIIEDVTQCDQINEAISKLSALAQSDDSALGSKPDPLPHACTFTACHTCRPYYRDRVFLSIDAVFVSNVAPVTPEETESLPIASAPVLCSIDIPRSRAARTRQTSISFALSTDGHNTTSNNSEATFMTTQSDLDEISAQTGPRRSFYRQGHRSSGDVARDLSKLPQLLTGHGLRTALQNIFQPNRESSSSGSNITLFVPRTGTIRNSHDAALSVGEFDIGALHCVRRQTERNQLRRGTYTGGLEDVIDEDTPNRTTKTNSLRTVSTHSCPSSSDSEEDEVGVGMDKPCAALPLKLPSPNAFVRPEKQPMVRTREMAGETDESIDMGGIMAQV